MGKTTIIRALEWNLNYATCDSARPAPFVSKYVEGCDFAVLSEVRENESLHNMINGLVGDYDAVFSDDQGKYSNQIAIIARKDFGLTKIKGSLASDVNPDFLHCRIVVNGKIINIVGFRVKIGGGTPWTDRFEQIKTLKSYLDNFANEKVIVLGDANCGQIRGSSEDDYSAVRSLYQYRRNKELSDLRYYNWHMIKEELGDRYVLKEIMGEDNSWGLAEKDGSLLYGLGTRVKNDILFYSKGMEGNSEYSWDHVRENENEYLNMFAKNNHKRGNKIEHGYPDHVRLLFNLYV